jgi:hypothetical protein
MDLVVEWMCSNEPVLFTSEAEVFAEASLHQRSFVTDCEAQVLPVCWPKEL